MIVSEVKEYNPERTYFTSDTHFYHQWMLDKGIRQFPDVETMNAHIIKSWNHIVKPGDTVFHLGDFAFTSKKNVTRLIQKLNGNIHLVMGNHDYEMKGVYFNPHFKSKSWQHVIRLGNHIVYLNHFPLLCFPQGKNHIQLFGHVHSVSEAKEKTDDQKKLIHLYPRQIEVGTDLHGYKPLSGKQIIEIIEKTNNIIKEKSDNGNQRIQG